ncbi:MAG TPA: lysylphosphatidylglycerol synthase domain-containing protein [Candidatus Saccharimonadales bacterium]
MKKHFKVALAILILVATGIIFSRYAASHPELFDKLGDTNPFLIILLLVGYVVWFLALAWVMRISLRLYGKTISFQENILLNAYSGLINFFGPGQSGPAVRGLYLKKRHQLPIKSYLFASLIYYAFYSVMSAFLLCVGSRPWWQTTIFMLAAAGGSAFVLRLYMKRSQLKNQHLNVKNLGWLFAATALQLAAQTLIFFAELRSVDASVSFAQALTYTGAGSFALFVALTPGGIGIREAFMLFAGQLHHISQTVVVAANVIDRGVYLLFLGILFILVVGLHAKDKLRLTKTDLKKS